MPSGSSRNGNKSFHSDADLRVRTNPALTGETFGRAAADAPDGALPFSVSLRWGASSTVVMGARVSTVHRFPAARPPASCPPLYGADWLCSRDWALVHFLWSRTQRDG